MLFYCCVIYLYCVCKWWLLVGHVMHLFLFSYSFNLVYSPRAVNVLF